MNTKQKLLSLAGTLIVATLLAASAVSSVLTACSLGKHFANAMNFGNVSRRLGKYDQAYEAYTGGLETKPDSDELYYNRGALQILMEKYPEAEQDLDKALELNPEYGEAWYCKAICRDRLGDAPGARKAYAMAIKYQPPCLNPHFSWGDHPENLTEPHGPAMRGEVIKGI